MTGNAKGAPAWAPAATLHTYRDTDGTRRCGSCGGWISRRCGVCAGEPDPDVSIEDIARGVADVDRATRNPA